MKVEEVTVVDQEVAKTSKAEVMGTEVDELDEPVEVWKCLGEVAGEFLTGILRRCKGADHCVIYVILKLLGKLGISQILPRKQRWPVLHF